MNKEKLGIALVGLGKYSEGQLAPALKETKHCELRGIVTGSNGKRLITYLITIYITIRILIP